MLKRCLRFRLGTPLGRVITMTVGFALLVPVATPVPAQLTKALDCNSDIQISLGVQTGSTVPVTLTVISGPATDAVDVPVIQTFPSITFFPSCSTTLPCVVDTGPPQPVTLGDDMRAGDDEVGDEEPADQPAAAPGTEPEIEITDDPASYDLGDLSDLNSFD